MRIEFSPNSEMKIVPECSTEAMALKYWEREYEEHGPKMLVVVTEIPVQLEHKKGG